MRLDSIIFTILGCLFVSFIVSLITFAIIGSRNYEKDFNKSLIISTITLTVVLFGLNLLYNSRISKLENMIYNTNSLEELQLNLKEENIE